MGHSVIAGIFTSKINIFNPNGKVKEQDHLVFCVKNMQKLFKTLF